MPRIPRSNILSRFHAMRASGEPIIGTGAGTGLSAKGEEAGGADLIVIYNSGRYRMAGRGSLAGMMPFGDANGIVIEMAREVLPVVARTPVLAGVCGTDPFREMDLFLDEVARLGFSGVQNFPTVGLIDGRFRAGLEETGMGYGREVEMIAKARARDLLTTPYVFDPTEAAAMAQAGADVLVCHFGLTVGGSIGAATSVKLEDCPALTDAMAEAALAVNRDVFILVHGGPVAEPADAEYVLARARHCHGFYGASSMERLPVERAVSGQVAKFKAIKKASDQSEEQARVGPDGRRAGRN
jgi:predicted TIM-barrel enzyme